MRYANIVHLSDLHLRSDEPHKFNQGLILDALVDDLALMRDTHLRPDCLIFSGDIVQSADDAVTLKEAATLISYLAEAAGLDDSRVFLCAGNHDASRKAVGPQLPDIKKFRQRATELDGLNKLATDHTFIEHVSGAFAGYAFLSENYGKKFRTGNDALTTQYYIREINLAVICVNTAAMTACGLVDELQDEKAIAFPELSLARALKRVPKGAQIVVVGHHPISFLADTASSVLNPVLFASVDLYMCGHLHAATPQTVFGANGQCTFAQSGSLYGARKWWNGYSIISAVVGEPHHRLTYRKWHEPRRNFGVASDLADDGVIYSTPESKIFWSTVTPKLDMRSLEKWRKQVLIPYLAEEFGADFTQMCSLGTFVEPEFEKDTYIETENGLEKTNRVETIELSEVMQSSENLVIGAQSESGKTTLARHWAHKLANQSVNFPDWSIPVVIRYSDIKNYVKSIERIAKQRLPNLPVGIDVQNLLQHGAVTFIVDDMDLKASGEKSAFDEFVAKYPACRYILLTGTVLLQGAGIAPVIVPEIPFGHIRLKQLKASQLLTLIESHGTKDPAQADRLLQRMVQEASSLNVPITPVTGTFFIQIYTEDSSQPLINRANLVERYIEISLEKFAPQELLPSSFDFHNKSDLLSFISEHMCRHDSFELAEQQFVNIITEYMEEYGLRFSSIDLLEYFVRAKILQRSGGFISFRLNAFMEYFAALRMVGQPLFREWVLDDSRYLSFCNEIAFYAAISRKDQSWLETLFERFRETSAEAWQGMPKEVTDGSMLETFVLPDSAAGESDLLQVERRIFEAPLTENERRELLDGTEPIITRSPSAVQRQLATDPGEKWLAQLTLLSAMLKNMELVPSKLKKAILRDVVQGWIQFLALSMGGVPTLAKEKRMKLAGIEYIVLFSDQMDVGEVARRIFMYMPISTAKLATHHLGTEKLRVQLEEGIGSEAGEISAVQQFMRAAILAQLGVDGLSKIVALAADKFADKGFLSSVFVRMLSEVVVRFRLPEAELRDIRLTAADAITRLEGKTGQRAAVRRGQVIESLTSTRRKVGLLDKKSERSLGPRSGG